MSRFATAVGTLCLIGWTMTSHAASVLDTVQLVSSTPAAASAATPAQTFAVSQSGSYTVTLTDLQLPVALSSLKLAIASSTSAALTMSAAGTQTVTLASGTYTVQLIATAATGALGGTFSVQVAPAGNGSPVFQYENTVGPAMADPTTGQSAVTAQFTASSGGTYQLNATDMAFPAGLTSLSVGVFIHCGTTPNCTPTAIYTSTLGSAPPFSAPLTLSAGNYDLFMVAKASPSAMQGLFSVSISGAGGTLYASTVPVGTLPPALPITFTAAGPATLDLVDLATPAPLASIKAVVAQNGVVLDQVAAAGSSLLTAAQGAAQLYVVALPGSGGQGSYEAYVTAASQTVADIAQPVLSTSAFGYAYSTNLASGGVYLISDNDFQKPVPLTSIVAIAAQQGMVLGSTQNKASFTAAAGTLNILVFPTPASATSEGLFGVTLAGPGSSATAFQTTQGVGALFTSQTVTIPAAGSYNVTLTDFTFPVGFSNLALIATNGTTVTGSIFNAGTLQLNLTAGSYVLSVLAQVGPNAMYGLYGLSVAPSPPAPTVTLTSSASSVTSGQTATLTWTSTNATSCTASGAWNGTLATSGTQSTGALTQNSSFTLTCSGGGGTGTATTQVTVTAVASSGSGGGGGALSAEALLALIGVLLISLKGRESMRDPRH